MQTLKNAVKFLALAAVAVMILCSGLEAATLRQSTALRNSKANQLTALIDAGASAGTIKIYTAPMPAHPADPPTGATLLGTLTFFDPAFGAADTGVATAGTITQDASADDTGTAAWARISDSNGNAIFDCDVTATGGGGVIQLNTTSIVAGGPITISSFTWTEPE